MLGTGLRSAPELETVRHVLDQERDGAQDRLESFQKERDDTSERARLLEHTGGVFHRDLLAARDLVDGELLAGHFDDLDPAQAGWVQARLGPLADAIVVDDASDAAAALDGRERELDTIWFVEGASLHDAVEPNGKGRDNGTDVTVEQSGIVRRTRVSEKPTLGRKARQKLIAELRGRVAELATRIGELEGRLAEIDSRRRDTALLTRELATLELGDPAPELVEIGVERKEHATRIAGESAAAADARNRATRLSRRADKLRDLLAEAFLLDEADLTARVEQLEDSVRAAARAQAELQRVAVARHVLIERIDVLRRSPLSEIELEEMRRMLAQLDGRRHRLYLALDALRYVTANYAALAWTDAEESLSAQQELVPSLKGQCDRAEREQRAVIEAVEEAERVYERARLSWRSIDDQRSAIAASREQSVRELAETGVDDASAAAVVHARVIREEANALVVKLDRAERELASTVARLAERIESREKAVTEAEERVVREEKECEPAEDAWERLRARAESRGLITPVVTRRLLDTGNGSPNLRFEARRMATLLEERLSTARGGREVLEQIRPRLSAHEQSTSEDYVDVWELVRDWLRRRVPAQVAEVDDPLEALARLRHHLAALGDRLATQEAELRGASEDVARGIDVHIRSAHRQVRLLNRELTGVHFGTIRGMRIRLARDDRMEAVLSALRQGSAQELLFTPTLPVEEALDELFKRHGGRGPTLGQKLLDYREYVDIAVEIRRQASADWERVNPSRLSTGEAIGVGTALMMVVLTAWEQAANLFRAKRSLGTLRFLFLDEANRLSHDNLEVLFELCTTLDLQLLIASPEVARAPGCTTYRLVRRETADGGEEVVVSGRRTMARNARDVGA